MEKEYPTHCANTLARHQGPVYVTKFNKDGNYLMSGSQDKTINLWNPHKGLHIKEYHSAHSQEISDITIQKENDKFASVGGDKQIYIWDVLGATVIRKFYGHDSKINKVQYNSYENILYSASFDTTVRIWDLVSKNSRELQVLDDFEDSIYIYTGSCMDGYIRIYDIRMGQITKDNIGHPIIAMHMSEDQKYLVISCIGSKIFLFDKLMGETISTYTDYHKVQDYSSEVRLGREGKYIYTCSETNTALVYDLVKKEAIYGLQGHAAAVVGMDIHPTQNMIATSSLDCTIKIWE